MIFDISAIFTMVFSLEHPFSSFLLEYILLVWALVIFLEMLLHLRDNLHLKPSHKKLCLNPQSLAMPALTSLALCTHEHFCLQPVSDPKALGRFPGTLGELRGL